MKQIVVFSLVVLFFCNARSSDDMVARLDAYLKQVKPVVLNADRQVAAPELKVRLIKKGTRK